MTPERHKAIASLGGKAAWAKGTAHRWTEEEASIAGRKVAMLRTKTTSRLRRLVQRAGQLWCGLTGHDSLIRFEAGRMYLECSNCGLESVGWECPVAERHVRTVRSNVRRVRTGAGTSTVPTGEQA